jgi:hypothetical protein
MTTQNPLPPVKLKKSWWRRLLKWTMRVVIVIVVLGIAAYASTHYWASRTIHNEIARIRAAGEPLTFADLDALTPKVERAQDAGPFYTAAAELAIADFEVNEANCDALFRHKAVAVPVEILGRARRSIEQNRLALELLDRGSALGGCNSDIQLQLGFEAAFPHMGKARCLCNVASLRTRVLALDGQGDQAIESVISALGLLRTMDRQPVLLGALVQTAMLGRGCDDARFVLEKGHPTDAGLQKLGEAMRRMHLIQPRQMFIAERVFFLEITRDAISMGPGRNRAETDTEGPAFPNAMWSSLGIAGRVIAAKSLPNHARLISAASGEWPEVLTAVEKDTTKSASWWDKVISPSLVNAMVLQGRQLSVYRATLIAIEIERFRLSHGGQLPDSLAQLSSGGDLAKDPFTGKSLLYVKTADGYCVFSAGRGQPEDGGGDRDKDPVAWSKRWGMHIRIR